MLVCKCPRQTVARAFEFGHLVGAIVAILLPLVRTRDGFNVCRNRYGRRRRLQRSRMCVRSTIPKAPHPEACKLCSICAIRVIRGSAPFLGFLSAGRSLQSIRLPIRWSRPGEPGRRLASFAGLNPTISQVLSDLTDYALTNDRNVLTITPGQD